MEAPRRTRWTFLGRIGYPPALALQLRLRDALRSGAGEEHLLLLEHDPVYTLGRNARETDVLAPRVWLAAQGAEVVECDRGGQVTYHGPGQLVGYPIVNLSPDRRDVRRYVRDLEAVLVRTLALHGVAAEGRDGAHIGVWAGERKLASIGVHLSRWITTHGFALNVTTDLAAFDRIVPCGLPGVRMGSIASLAGGAPTVEAVARQAAACFGEVFGRTMTEVDAAPLRELGAASTAAPTVVAGAS